MKKTALCFIAVCLFCSCMNNVKEQKNQGEIPLMLIDTTHIHPGVMSIIHDYIQAHPKYHSLTLIEFAHAEHYGISYEKTFFLQLIGPSCKGLFHGGEWSYSRTSPQSYFRVDDRIVFVSTPIDNLMQDNGAKEIYEQYEEQVVDSVVILGNSYSKSSAENHLANSWVIYSGREKTPEVLSMKPDTFITRMIVEFTPPSVK